MRRLRLGELTALLGAAVVIVSMTRPWYETPSGNEGFWATFGLAAALILLALAAALAMVAAALTERDSVALQVSTAVWCVLLGLVGWIASVVRLLERPDRASGLCAGTWLGFAGALLILAGAWAVLRDERPSRYPPAQPEPRPRP